MDVLTSRVGSAGSALLFAAAALLAPLASTAEAQVCVSGDFFCENADADWQATSALFDNIGFDTGFVPGGSPVQLRVFFNVAAETNVSMSGTVRADWPSPLTVHVTGEDGDMGNINMNYGISLGVQLRYDVLTFDGVIDIPIPGIPSDLAFIDSADFDPLLLPGEPGRPVAVSDSSGRITAVEVNVLGAIVPIPGLEGNLGLDIEAILGAAWRTNDVLIDGASAVSAETDGVLVGPSGFGGFGSHRDIDVQPRGRLDFTGDINLIPTLTFKILSFEIASIDLGNAAVQVLNDQSALSLSEDVVRIPLPDVAVSRTTVPFGDIQLGSQGVQTVEITNNGMADLMVDFRGFPQPFGVDPSVVVVAPGATETVDFFFIPVAVGGASAFAIAETNDPDRPQILFRPSANVVEPPMDMGTPMADAGVPMDAAVPMDGSVPTMDGSVPVTPDLGSAPGVGGLAGGACGCRITASDANGDAAPMTLALLVLGLVAWRRRRG